MRLETTGGQIFDLNIDRYEFPNEELGPTDDNPASDFDRSRFLYVRCRFLNNDGEWEAVRPILTTTELEQLSDWLESIQNKSVCRDGVYFTERDIEFSIDDRRENLLVHVSYSFLPKWASEVDSLSFRFPIRELNLKGAIQSLKAQLKKFPSRSPLK